MTFFGKRVEFTYDVQRFGQLLLDQPVYMVFNHKTEYFKAIGMGTAYAQRYSKDTRTLILRNREDAEWVLANLSDRDECEIHEYAIGAALQSYGNDNSVFAFAEVVGDTFLVWEIMFKFDASSPSKGSIAIIAPSGVKATLPPPQMFAVDELNYFGFGVKA